VKIIIVGCGKIGTAILGSLTAEGHDVVAVDLKAERVNVMTNVFDVMGVVGNGVDYETLTEAGVADADLFVAMTGSDELNMLSCYFAGKMGARHTIARIRNPEYNDQNLRFMQQNLNLSMSVNPDLLAAREIFNMLRLPSAAKVESFSRGNLEMVELRLQPGSKLCGLKLSRAREVYNAKFLICAVQRGDEVIIPGGSFELREGDRIGLMAERSELQKLIKLMGIHRRQARNVMILGGSKTAFYLARMLSGFGSNVKIVEKDPERCEMLSAELPGAVVINGDGSSLELLLEEGLDNLDAFVTLTGMDEANILLGLHATHHNVPRVILKVNREELAEMARKMGQDSLVSPKDIVSNILVRFARALENSRDSNVETLYKLMDGKAEALEFIVLQESRLTGVPLKDLNFKKNILIAGILRGRRIIIPSGDDKILPGDHVVVLAAGQRLQDLLDILA